MTASDLDLTTVQLAQTEPANYVDLPKGNTVILLPVQPGQTVRLPTDSTDGVLAKIGPEGNLALVVDGRTIILQGFLKANDQSPIKIVTSDGDDVDVADLVAATDPSLDIQTAAGPASGDQGDTDGSGIYIPFLAGPGLGGLDALGILDPTALQYRLIDDEFKLFSRRRRPIRPTSRSPSTSSAASSTKTTSAPTSRTSRRSISWPRPSSFWAARAATTATATIRSTPPIVKTRTATSRPASTATATASTTTGSRSRPSPR